MEPLLAGVLVAAAIVAATVARAGGPRELKRRWDQASLEYDLRHGRQPYGRTRPDLGDLPGGLIEVETVVEAKLEAVLIEAGTGRRLHPYTREPLADGETVELKPPVVTEQGESLLADLEAEPPRRKLVRRREPEGEEP